MNLTLSDITDMSALTQHRMRRHPALDGWTLRSESTDSGLSIVRATRAGRGLQFADVSLTEAEYSILCMIEDDEPTLPVAKLPRLWSDD